MFVLSVFSLSFLLVPKEMTSDSDIVQMSSDEEAEVEVPLKENSKAVPGCKASFEEEAPVKKQRAKRTSKKVEATEEDKVEATPAVEEAPKRKRGRPKKVVDPDAPVKPKRKCTPAQLAALAAGRAKNSRFHPKKKEE